MYLNGGLGSGRFCANVDDRESKHSAQHLRVQFLPRCEESAFERELGYRYWKDGCHDREIEDEREKATLCGDGLMLEPEEIPH